MNAIYKVQFSGDIPNAFFDVDFIVANNYVC